MIDLVLFGTMLLFWHAVAFVTGLVVVVKASQRKTRQVGYVLVGVGLIPVLVLAFDYVLSVL